MLTDWCENTLSAWGGGPHVARHGLAEHAIFTDEGLAKLLTELPRDTVHVYAMGDDPQEGGTWRRGCWPALTAESLLDHVRTSRLWLNIVAVDQFSPEMRDLLNELYGSVKLAVGHAAWRDLTATLLVSSPHAQVFFHADKQPNALWHIRGRKRVWVYPDSEPFLKPGALPRISADRDDEQLPFKASFDSAATVLNLQPGDVAWWPQNRPHRVVNTEGLNVSLSVEMRTDASIRRERIHVANYYLGRYRIPVHIPHDASGPGVEATLGATRIWHRFASRRTRRGLLPATFELLPNGDVKPLSAGEVLA